MALFSLDDDRVQTPAGGEFWVADSAAVIGKVRLGVDASIWFNAVLRGDNEPITIGARSNIQDGSVVHVDPGYPVIVEDDCTIGHMAMLHGCIVERGSLIGIGAVILNGAVIGAGSLIGAGALVTEGKKIPPNSVVMGRPGKVVRPVSDEDSKRMMSGVHGYVARSKHYAMALRRQA